VTFAGVSSRCSTRSFPGEQGEIDVIAIRSGEPQAIYFAEVTTHLKGIAYGANKPTSSV
jgi:hypothetical protein